MYNEDAYKKEQKKILDKIEKLEAKAKKRLKRLRQDTSESMRGLVVMFFADYSKDGVIDYHTVATTKEKKLRKFDLVRRHHMEGVAVPFVAHEKMSVLDALKYNLYFELIALSQRERDVIDAITKDVYEMNAKNRDYKADLDPLYKNAVALSDRLTQTLEQSLVRKDSKESIIQNLTDYFERINQRNADRIMYTEDTLALSESIRDLFEDDYPTYHIETMRDDRVCQHCKDIEKISFPFADAKVGVNYPPLHPYCRCIVVPENSIPEGVQL